MTKDTPTNRYGNQKAIGSFKKGSFIQALFRQEGDTTPPPIHYIGSTNTITNEVNAFSSLNPQ